MGASEPHVTRSDAPPPPESRNPTPKQLALIEGQAGVEFINGQIVRQQMSKESVRIGTTIVRLLGNANAGKSVEVYMDGLAYRCFPDLPKLYRKPDVSVVSKARLRKAAITGDIGVMPIAADLAVEVISPRDLANDVRRKLDEYRAAKFGQVWLVYPELHGVFTWREGGRVDDLSAEDEITVGTLLPEFRCKVSAFFED